MKKNLFYIALALTLCLSLLAGCTPEGPTADPENPGTESPGMVTPDEGQASAGDWERDGAEHWQLGPSGEKNNAGEHSLDGANVCTVCGSEVWRYEELTAVNDYGADGEQLRASSYDTDGGMICDLFYEYADGLLESVTEYYANGTKSISEYDERGDQISWFHYDAEGTLITEVHYEYAVGEDGVSYPVKTTDLYRDGSKHISEFNDHGENISSLEYDADGNLLFEERYEWEYDADGNWLTQKVYTDGELTHMTEYATYTSAMGPHTLPKTITDYFMDGSRMVSSYDENGALLRVRAYDADGNLKAVG